MLQFFIAAFIAAFILFYFTCAAGLSVEFFFSFAPPPGFKDLPAIT